MALNFNPKKNKQTINEIKPSGSATPEVLSFLKTLAFLIALVWIIRASIIEPFRIPSSSMEPTLERGDYILVNKLSYGLRAPAVKKTLFKFRPPQRQDVVVFTRPDDPRTPKDDESNTNIIKRIVGLPGDSIEVKGMEVLVNGEMLPEEYSRWLNGGQKSYDEVTVPEGHVFLLGDNRDHSKDSRYWSDPFLPVERIKGRAFLIYWNSYFSFNRIFKSIN